ncbi:MAG TPA: lipopolysaccharide biosynthesis protein [Acidimicrobiales bacterium]|nr:lipopolysaccharide biosynthesis protein [Acidimicrobiales bacterium]
MLTGPDAGDTTQDHLPVQLTEEVPGLRAQVTSGLRWGMVDQGFQQFARLAILAVLTKLVAPADFGIIAMAFIVTQLADLLGDLGFGSALVHRRELSPEHVTTATTLSGLAGLLMAAVVAWSSPHLASFFEEPDLHPVLLVMSLTFIFRALQGAPRQLLQRELRFRPIVVSTVIAVSVGGVAGVVLAFLGAGVWALVAYSLGETFVAFVAVALAALRAGVWHPRIGINRAAAADLAGFGAYSSGFRLIYYGQTNIDNLIVGKVLGATALGFYGLAYRLMLFPIQKVADVVWSVVFPAFSSIQHDIARIRTAFCRAIRSIALLCFPASLGIAVTAPVLIPLVFGSRWLPAVATVQILALNGPRIAMNRLNGAVYSAIGKPSLDFWMAATGFFFYVIGFAVGVGHGIAGVATGFTVAGYLLLPVSLGLVARTLQTRVHILLMTVVPVAAASAAMALCAWLALVMVPESTGFGLRFAASVAGGGTAYSAYLLMFAPHLLTDARDDLLNRVR